MQRDSNYYQDELPDGGTPKHQLLIGDNLKDKYKTCKQFEF